MLLLAGITGTVLHMGGRGEGEGEGEGEGGGRRRGGGREREDEDREGGGREGGREERMKIERGRERGERREREGRERRERGGTERMRCQLHWADGAVTCLLSHWSAFHPGINSAFDDEWRPGNSLTSGIHHALFKTWNFIKKVP